MTQPVVLHPIEVVWTGPHLLADLTSRTGPGDYGLLCVYGSHPVFGSDALLYVDEAREGPFAARLERIRPWTKHLPSEPSVYVGRLGGTEIPDWQSWMADIQRAYRLTVFFHSPPWNTQGVNHHGLTEPTVVLNVGRRHRLALEVSTLWDASTFDPDGGPWQPYQPLPPPVPEPESDPAA